MNTRVSLAMAVAVLCALVALGGCTRRLAFATATKFALDVSQRADQTVEVSLGYDRVEVVSIPSVGRDGSVADAGRDTDAYSVLGTILIRHGNPFRPDGEGLRIHQFFATGRAALKLAENDNLSEVLGREAGRIYKEGRTATTDPAR